MTRSHGFVGGIGCLLGALALQVHAAPDPAPELLPAPRVEALAAAELLPAPRLTYFDTHDDPIPAGALARMGTVRLRHGEPLRFVAFAAEGQEIVTAADDGFVRVWDRTTGKELRHIALTTGNSRGQSSSGYSDGTLAVMRISTYRESPAVALSPDGRTLAINGSNGTTQLYETATGRKLHALRGGNYAALLFSPDSKRLAIKDTTNVIHIWDVATGKEVQQLNKQKDTKNRFYFGNDQGRTMAFTPDGKALAAFVSALGDNQQPTMVIKLWDIDSAKETRQIKEVGANFFAGMALAMVPDGKSLLWSSYDGIIRHYDLQSGKMVRQLGQQQFGYFPSELGFLPDGKTVLAKIARRATIHVWDLESGKELRTIGEPSNPMATNFWSSGREGHAQEMAVSSDGKVVAMAGPASATRLWDVASGKEILPVEGHTDTLSALQVTPDGKSIFTGGACTTVRQWDLGTGKELRQVALPGGAEHMLFSADGRYAAFGLPGNKVQIWDLAAGKELHNVALAQVQMQLPGGGAGMVFFADGKTLAIKDYNSELRLIETATGNETKRFSLRSDVPGTPTLTFINGLTPGIAVSSDGRYLATVERIPKAGGDPNRMAFGNEASSVIRLWNPETGKMLCQFDAPKADILAVAFAPDGRSIASAHQDGSVTLWEAATGKERGRFTLKAGGGNVLGKVFGLVAPANGNNLNEPSLGCVAFSRDGRILAAGSEDRTIHLWDVRSGKKLGVLAGHLGGIRALTFTRDGQRLVSASQDTTALVWDATHFHSEAAPSTAELTKDQLEALTKDLAGADAVKAFRAIHALEQTPRQVTPLLQEQARAQPPVDAKRLQQLLEDLDNGQFTIRQQAEQELQRLGDMAEPAMRRALEGKPSLEIRQRVEGLLARLGGPITDTQTLRTIRAIELLEAIGTPEARQVLQKLGAGADGARVTREAKAALQRLAP